MPGPSVVVEASPVSVTYFLISMESPVPKENATSEREELPAFTLNGNFIEN